ncbi:MAG: DoxX family protein [Candidatus Eremiobacteraeota bacterium]|nr:DoxX family protein [Candidatus Eremiobacteraeota bacterium]MBC5826378.1 DoxX family protein [Candidatus Eremiobacteraeota bacterium]
MSHDLGTLAVRVILGAAIAAHGAQKLFGWFGGHGINGTGGFFESIGFRPGKLFAIAAGCGEFFGGLLVLLGFLGPVGATLIVATMTVAMLTVHRQKGFFAAGNGVELPLLFAVAALATAFAGPGRLSLDSALGLGSFDSAKAAWIGLAVAVVGALANVALRRPQAPASQSANQAT